MFPCLERIFIYIENFSKSLTSIVYLRFKSGIIKDIYDKNLSTYSKKQTKNIYQIFLFINKLTDLSFIEIKTKHGFHQKLSHTAHNQPSQREKKKMGKTIDITVGPISNVFLSSFCFTFYY